MTASRKETEVKLRFASAEDAKRRLAAIGAVVTTPRLFEDNQVYDRPDGSLARRHDLLRLRRAGERSWLTFKRKTGDDARHKVRDEIETAVTDADATAALLDGLGFVPTYRYQKYRTKLERPGLDISLDETPVGCFVELEGEADRIDAAAAELGFSPEQYVVKTYRELQEDASPEGAAAGDMLMGTP